MATDIVLGLCQRSAAPHPQNGGCEGWAPFKQNLTRADFEAHAWPRIHTQYDEDSFPMNERVPSDWSIEKRFAYWGWLAGKKS